MKRTEATPSELVLVIGMCFGWAIVYSTYVAFSGFDRQGFSDARLAGGIAFELTFASLALLILHRRGYSVETLYPAPSISGALLGTALYAAATFSGLMLATVITTFASWDPTGRMMKAAHPSLALIVPAAIVNGSYEEIFMLGFLMRALLRYGASIALSVPVLVRVLYHTYQGPSGTVFMFGYALVVGLFYLRTSALFPAVFCHILDDIIPFFLASDAAS